MTTDKLPYTRRRSSSDAQLDRLAIAQPALRVQPELSRYSNIEGWESTPANVLARILQLISCEESAHQFEPSVRNLVPREQR